MTDGLLFANAVAKSKENNLLTSERLERLIDSLTLTDAVKVLAEVNYGGGIMTGDPNNFEAILAAEETLADTFIKKLKLDGAGTDCFILQSDYHNIKAILKSIYGNAELDKMAVREGLYELAYLKERLLLDEPNINIYVDDAVKAIKKAFEIKKSPRLIDTLVDKAMFNDIAGRLGKKGVSPLIKSYFAALADITNIDSMLRCVQIDADFAFFEASFAAGGSVPKERFAAVFAANEDRLAEITKGTPYGVLAGKYNEGGLARLAAASDDYLLNIFRGGKNDMFSAAPAIGYYLAKKQEVRMLRIALVCIKNKVAKAEIRKRMRALYA